MHMPRIASRLLLLVSLPLTISARDLPPIDAFAAAKPHADAAAAVAAKARGLTRAGRAIPVEARLRVPTFVWPEKLEHSDPPPSATPGEPRRREEAAARDHVKRFSGLYGLTAEDVTDAGVAMVHNTGRGAIVVKLRQQIDGVEVFREEMNVVMDRDLRLIGIGGYLSSAATSGSRGGAGFRLDDRTAATAALSDLTGVGARPQDLIPAASPAPYVSFTIPDGAGARLEAPLRAKKVYFHLQEGLEPAYYVEVVAHDPVSGGVDAYAYVISAHDGRILFRNSLTADAGTPYTYRVWAGVDGRPFDSPAGNDVHPKVDPVNDGYQAPLMAQQDVTLANYPFSMNDPWLPPGATETAGNNVDAYSDVVWPDGYGSVANPATPATGDFRAFTTGTNAFLHTYDYSDPHHHIQRQAATVQLFFDINFLHDWFYDAGFDEASGNAQQTNYGRGGLEGDRLRAEAQDYSGTNNANMQTPADGGSPRMQMYYFSPNTVPTTFVVHSPQAAKGGRVVGVPSFGATKYDVTADVVHASPLSACAPLTNAATVAGKIVIVDREPTSGADSCSITTKLNNIAAAGAGGIILVNFSGWPDTIYTPTESVNLPYLTITYNASLSIKAELNAGNTVTGQMYRDGGFYRDSAIDNQIVAHEWGHYLSNRLIGNATGLTNNQGRGMGEGWSDFLSLLLTVREEDANVASNATWNGVYPAATYSMGGGPSGGSNSAYYFGIRRVPYSTDMSKNPFTFKHIQHGVPLPATAPIRSNSSSNAQVHNTGEIWGNMLWECYAALLRDTQGASPRLTFAEAQSRMKEYLVAALKVTPSDPTFIEARDALVAVALASDETDFVLFMNAFAKRGAGAGAVAADRYSTTNSPVVESFVSGGDAKIVAHALSDVDATCDGDGVLDAGETGELSLTLKNTGTVALNGVTATVTTTTAGVTFPSGAGVVFPPLDPLASVTAVLPVALSAGFSGATAAFAVEYADASMEISPQVAQLAAVVNVDVVKRATATDTADSASAPWTTTSGTIPPAAPWSRQVVGPSSVWKGAAPGHVSDERLESPPMTISSGGHLRIDFDHRYSFESNYDGGVIEMSVNGAGWIDIGAPLYVYGYIYGNNSNPLSGRYAFTGAGGPRHETLTPVVEAGDVVRVRFRIGTDGIFGSTGWEIDNIAFGGVIETPFDLIVPHAGCTKPSSTRVAVSVSPSKSGEPVMLTGLVATAGDPAGTITFYDGATSLGAAALSGNTATLVTSALTVGPHDLTAQYGGTAGVTGSTSSVLLHVVDDCTSAPVFTSLPENVSIPAGGEATMTAVTSSSAAVLDWYQGTSPDRKNHIGTGASVTVRPTYVTNYWVRARNACGSTASATIPVTIIQPSRFYTMTPCRFFDSRSTNEPLGAGASRSFSYYSSSCYVPSYARALAANVTVVAPTADGQLTLYPGTGTPPGTSTASFRVGKTRANNTIIGMSPGWPGYFSVYNGSAAPVHYIIDVFGYFY